MKTNKWLWRTLAVLLVLVVMAGVGFAGYRMGIMQGANLTANGTAFMFTHGRGFDGGMMRGGFDHPGFSYGRADFGGRGGFSPFGFIFGLVRLAVFAGLIWLGYHLVKNSGWKLVKTEAAAAPSVQDSESKDQAQA